LFPVLKRAAFGSTQFHVRHAKKLHHLTKEELIEKLEEIELYPELKKGLGEYLSDYVHQKDLKVVTKLLKAGANPNSAEGLNDYLLYLLHEYEVEKNTNGELVLLIMKTLLENGANPNRVAMNNLRAYDYAVAHNTIKVAKLLREYEVNVELREVI
jgi:hypothetical protein